MTLKLIDKDLKSKYAEVLYKNEVSYEKEIDRRFKRLHIDFMRNSQMVDAGSQVFLNRIRQKRSKWTQDDLNFRDHYRLVCRNVTKNKLENLRQALSSGSNAKRANSRHLDPALQSKLNILEDQLNDDRSSSPHSGDLPLQTENEIVDKTKALLVPKLPDIKNMTASIDEDLYSKYSKSDREFLDKYPAKVELTVTDIGKQFLYSEKHKHFTLKKQKLKNSRIQTSACNDARFNNLVNFLE